MKPILKVRHLLGGEDESRFLMRPRDSGGEKKEANEVGRAAYDNRLIEAEVLDSVHFEGELGGAAKCVHDLLLLVRSGEGCADAPFGEGDAHLDPDTFPLGLPCTASCPLSLLQKVQCIVRLSRVTTVEMFVIYIEIATYDQHIPNFGRITTI